MSRSLWGITTFFNPTGARRRIDNYRRFRAGSKRQGLPLVAVELAFDEDQFELVEGQDAEIVVRRRAQSVLWQKERLLNLALAELPDTCTGVCWADADVLFEDDDWVSACERLLEEVVVLQPFSAAVRLPADGSVAAFPGSEVGRRITEGNQDATYSPSLCSKLDRRWLPKFAGTTGYVWCARRSLLDEVGFYDRCIVGGGDREFALAIAYTPGEVPRRNIRIHHPRLRDDIRRWHERVHPLVDKRIGHRPGVIHHLWHGASGKRNYVDRHQLLIDHDFDPQRDIVLDAGGCWSWAPGNEALIAAVKNYFQSRQEDG